MKTKKLKKESGFTVIDAVIAVVSMIIFTGLLVSFMYKNYQVSLQVQATSNANAYATLIMEKVDEKPFEEIDSNFISKLTQIQDGADRPELEIDSKYTVSFNATTIDEYFKRCEVTVTYGGDSKAFNYKEKKITLKKLKIKEIGNN